MCGIVGIISEDTDITNDVLQALERLEYRGYDSSGIAVVENCAIHTRRAEGKLRNLKTAFAQDPVAGKRCIGHIRWATHGEPIERNAHPHSTQRVSVVHNGIIENFRELKSELENKGIQFHSDTDSEVIVHLLDQALQNGMDIQEAVETSLSRLEGAFALAILLRDQNCLIGARRGSPLAVGLPASPELPTTHYLASDGLALSLFTRNIIFLEDDDWCILTPDNVQIFNLKQGRQTVQRPAKILSLSPAAAEKGQYRHFMLKEIFEQPTVFSENLATYCAGQEGSIKLPSPDIESLLASISAINMTACGTAYYAGMVGRYWFEQFAQLPVMCEVASQVRYHPWPYDPRHLILTISQSGETADTLAAMRSLQERGQKAAAIVNVPESSLVRESNFWLPTHAGPEIGVASTKAFSCQLVTLICLALATAQARGTLRPMQIAWYVRQLMEMPRHLNEVLHESDTIKEVAGELTHASSMLYISRGSLYPLALEGALKMKEISYIHCHGYAAGEMKHGPIALIDEQTPVVVMAPSDELFDKMVSNIYEITARGARVILFSDEKGIDTLGDKVWRSVRMPKTDSLLNIFPYTVAAQLLAYHTAVQKGTDVDQPRNLAKSVTVE